MRSRLILVAGAVAVLAAPSAHAQTGFPAVDSATVARDAWRAAGEARRAGTPAVALALVSRAAHAWPVQPAYWTALARFAAAANRVAEVSEALTALAELRAGASLLTDTAVARVAPSPVLARLRAATADSAASTIVATIADSTIFAEGVDADPATGALFVASVRHRTVYEVSPSGAVRDIGLGRAPRMGAVLGVRVAPDGVHLWVTTTGLAQSAAFARGDSTIAALLQVRRADGQVVRRWDLPANPRGHVLGDLTVGPRGDVFVTDSRAPLLLRLRPDADTLEQLTHPLFRSLQGAAAAPDGRTLYIADYSHGLLRLDLVSGTVDRLADAPGSTSLGVDGIVLYGNAIIGVQNGIEPPRIVRFDLSGDGRRIARATRLDQRSSLADEPTIGTIRGDRYVYVANSQWEKFDDDGKRRAGTALAPTVLLEIRLGGRASATAP